MNTLVSAQRFLGTVLLVVVSLPCGCSNLDRIRRPPQHPMPRNPPGADTAVAYVRQQGDWCQFRVELEGREPRHDEEYDYYHLSFRAAASVWRFNRKTGEYDIRSHTRGPGAERSVVFAFDSGDEIKLRMVDSGAGASGGSAGWPDNNLTEARISIDPEPSSLGVLVEDGMVFRVMATASMKPANRDGNMGLSPVEITTEQKWRMDILYPRKRVAFRRLP